RQLCAGCPYRSSAASRTAHWCWTCAVSTWSRGSLQISTGCPWRAPMGWLDRMRSPQASPADPMAEALAAARHEDYATALSIWEPLARAGNARAQSNIAACFLNGLGVERNAELAAKWLRLAAAAGDPVGQRNLATLHFRGEGVAQDDDAALRLYRLAADQGDAAATDMLSWMLAEKGNYEEARIHAEAAAAQGVAAAM